MSAATPRFAEQARTLLHLARTATLSTQSQRDPGFPFGSAAPYGLDGGGAPTLLLSRLAVHTTNLAADPRASLFVADPTATADPLALARVTLIGTVITINPSAHDAVRADYLRRHPTAGRWIDFADFAFYRMDVREAYYVGGFGAMGWVSAADYAAAAPDPLADSAAGILAHMNADHADALRLYCQVFASVAADSAAMTAVDRLGFQVRAIIDDQIRDVRINFPREARTPEAARVVLVEMVREARARNQS